MTPERIADLLRQGIREKVLPAGSPLIQEDLASRFGVSRNPVREALRTLASEGLVSMPPGEGATVRRLSKEDLEEIYDLRIALEPLIASRVIAEARGRDLDLLQAMATEMDTQTDVEAWMRLNFEFHRMIYQLANRGRTESILTGLLSAVQPYSLENVQRLGGRSQADQEHSAMITAIRNSDSIGLSGLLVEHLQAAKDRLAKAYEEAEQPDPLRLLRAER